jgi:hypothetical protein
MDYLIQSTLCLGALTLCYWLIAKNLKFHNLNRLLLGFIFVLTFTLPLLKYDVPLNPFGYFIQNEKHDLELSNEAEVNFLSADEVSNLVNSDLKGTNQVLMLPESQSVFSNLDWWNITFWIYLIGATFFLLRFGIQWVSLLRFFSRTKKSKEESSLYISPEDISPFSFFNKIVVPSSLLNSPELKVILSHEKNHQQSGHTFDVFMAEFIKIIHWFNPLAWVYNRLVRENLEYLADGKIVQQGFNKQAYQTCLVNSTFQVQPIPLANSFANSLIKKRIVMMNKTNNSSFAHSRYALFLIPLFVLTSYFNIDQGGKIDMESTPQSYKNFDEHHFIIGPKATIEELTQLKEYLAEKHGVKMVFNQLKFNGNNEITHLNVGFHHDGGYVSKYATPSLDKYKIFPVHYQLSIGLHGTYGLTKDVVSGILTKQTEGNAGLHLYGIDKTEFAQLDLKQHTTPPSDTFKFSYIIAGMPLRAPFDPHLIKEISENISTDSDGSKRKTIYINLDSGQKRSLPLYNYPEDWIIAQGSTTYGGIDKLKMKIIREKIESYPFEPYYYIDGLPTSLEILKEFKRFKEVVVKNYSLKPKGQQNNVTEITEVRINTKDLSNESKSDGFGTGKGKKSTTAFDDGSTAWLNSESALRYSGEYTKKNRNIYLTYGEFYFKMIEHQYPFAISFKNLKIEGNSQSEFNINGYQSGQIIITPVIGTISLSIEEGQRIVKNWEVSPGTSQVYDLNGNSVVEIDITKEDALAWKRGELTFKQDNIDAVIKKLERWFGVDISIEGETSSALTGSFKNQSLEETLKSISRILEFDYAIKDKDVSIKF